MDIMLNSLFLMFLPTILSKEIKPLRLTDPYSILFSDKMANKLFPHEDALGKYVKLEKKYDLKVTGIYKELPFNTIVRPSYIIPIQLFEKTNNWENVH